MQAHLTLPQTRMAKIGLFLLLFAAIVGVVDSVLIHLKEIAALTNPSVYDSCTIGSTFNCAEVASSKYSKFAGIPVSLLGIFFYQSVLVLSGTMLFGFTLQPWMKTVGSIGMVLSLFFSLRLLYYSWFAVGFLCPYCLVSNVSTLLVVKGWFLYNYRLPKWLPASMRE